MLTWPSLAIGATSGLFHWTLSLGLCVRQVMSRAISSPSAWATESLGVPASAIKAPAPKRLGWLEKLCVPVPLRTPSETMGATIVNMLRGGALSDQRFRKPLLQHPGTLHDVNVHTAVVPAFPSTPSPWKLLHVRLRSLSSRNNLMSQGPRNLNTSAPHRTLTWLLYAASLHLSL